MGKKGIDKKRKSNQMTKYNKVGRERTASCLKILNMGKTKKKDFCSRTSNCFNCPTSLGEFIQLSYNTG